VTGYSGKPVVQKLGIKPGFCIFTSGAPAAYADIVGKLPADVTIVTRLASSIDMVHLFATEGAGLEGKLRGFRDAITPDGYEARIDLTITDEGPTAHAFVIISAVAITAL